MSARKLASKSWHFAEGRRALEDSDKAGSKQDANKEHGFRELDRTAESMGGAGQVNMVEVPLGTEENLDIEEVWPPYEAMAR